MNHLPNAEPLLLRDDRDGIVTLTLNRPKAFNTLSGADDGSPDRLGYHRRGP